MVASDINGDGYANDRAFVPSLTDSDPTVAASMKSLLDNATPEARKCIESQLGTLARRGSCQGPWFSNASMSISFNPLKVRMPQRASLSFQLSNPIGAADLIAHGSDNLRGWGQPVSPDQQLLYARGFDPIANRYKYEVNSRFGSANQAFGAFRVPVTLTAMMRFDVGPTRERQLLTQQLDRGRRTEGNKAPEVFLKAMYGNGGFPNPIATILRQQDSLHLTGAQADSLATMNRLYTIKNDATWAPLAKQFADLPDTYDKGVAYDKYMTARRATIDLLAQLAPHIKGLLTAEQRRKLPTFVATYLEPRYLASIKAGTNGFTANAAFGGGSPVMMGEFTAMAAGGGGGQQIIIRQ